MIEDLIDNISDGISDLLGNDIDASNAIDVFSGASEKVMDSLLNGDFNNSNADFTSLFEDTSNVINDNVNGMDVGTEHAVESIDGANSMHQHSGVLGEKDNHADEIIFSSRYSEDEIKKMEEDVESAQYEVTICKSKVSNWESKVSLNNTQEHRKNGDYSYAIDKLNEAISRYNDAVSKYNSAKNKLNNAR